MQHSPPQVLPTGDSPAICALHSAQAACPALVSVLPLSVLYRDATWILLDTGALSSSEPRPVPGSAMRKTGRDTVTACTDPSLVPLLILLASFDCRDFVPSLQALQQYPLHMGSSQLPSDSPSGCPRATPPPCLCPHFLPCPTPTSCSQDSLAQPGSVRESPRLGVNL